MNPRGALRLKLAAGCLAALSVLLVSTVPSAGDVNPQLEDVTLTSILRSGTNISLTWTGAVPPYKIQGKPLGGAWLDRTYHIYENSYSFPASSDAFLFRVRTIPDLVPPTAPLNLTATPEGCDRVQLQWGEATDPRGGTGLRGYRLLRDGVFIKELPAGVTSTLDLGLAPARTYSYRVASIDLSLNQSTPTAAVPATTGTCPGLETNQPPVAVAGANVFHPAGLPLNFNGSGSSDVDGTITDYRWDFGDGSSAGGVAASHTYVAAGTYTARLTVTDNGGGTSASTVIVTITNEKPVASAGADRSGRIGVAIAFDGSNSSDEDGAVAGYAWSFGDGGLGAGAVVSHAFGTLGTFQVRLTVTDLIGATGTDDVLVTITNVPPVAVAGSGGAFGVGFAVGFDGTGSSDPDGTLSSYAWDFGDGVMASGATGSHAYASAGVYTARLTVTDNTGAASTATRVVTITNGGPVAAAGADRSGRIGVPIGFNGSGSTDADGTLAGYSWSFGDGGQASGVSVSHAYQGVGTFLVRLTVTDNGGATGTDELVVTITNVPPVANVAGPSSGNRGQSLSFSGAGSSDPDGQLTSFSWDFGDGTGGSGVNVNHSFAAPGGYDVRLTVTDNRGAVATAVMRVTIVNLGPTAVVTGTGSGAVGSAFSFQGSASSDPDGSIVSYGWSFGDQGSGSGASTSHVFQSPGIYEVRLTVTDNNGASASSSMMVSVTNTPPVARAGADQVGGRGVSLTFSGSASSDVDGTVAGYSWNFGDQSSASGAVASHSFQGLGTFQVQLTVTDNSGATHTDGLVVTVTNRHPVAVAGGNRSAVAGAVVGFSSAGTFDPDGSIVSYSWSFGDGSAAAGGVASHSYSSAGSYTATLTVIDNSGAAASASVVVTVTSDDPPPPVGGRAELAGYLPGLTGARDVVVAGDFAYVASQQFGLTVVDVRDSATPEIVGAADVPFDGERVVVRGGMAYLTGIRNMYLDGTSTYVQRRVFVVVDISVPSRPVVRGMYESSLLSLKGLDVAGDYVFVASASAGVQIFDVSNPEAPSIAAVYNTAGSAWSVVVEGSRLYVADGSAGLVVLDVSNPLQPLLLGVALTPGTAKELAKEGDRVYVGEGRSMYVVDVSQPASPAVVATYFLTGSRVAVQNGVVFVAAAGSGVVATDVAALPLGLPLALGNHAPEGRGNGTTVGLAVAGNRIYMANSGAGLEIVEFVRGSLTPFRSLSTLTDRFIGDALVVRNGFAYQIGTHAWDGGFFTESVFRVIDIRDPARPVVLGRLVDSGEGFRGLEVQGNHAYLSVADGVDVVDISNPAVPVKVAHSAGASGSVTISGRYAYVAEGFAGVRILDIINPLSPQFVAQIDTPDSALHTTIAGNLAYVSDNFSVRIYNLSNPSSPQFVGSFLGRARRTVVENGTLYVAGVNEGLTIVGVSNPASPVLMGSLVVSSALIQGTLDMVKLGAVVYLANGEGGLISIDVSDPSQPELVAAMVLPGFAGAIAGGGEVLALSDSEAGLSLFRLAP